MLRTKRLEPVPIVCPRDRGPVLIHYSTVDHCESCPYSPCLEYENGSLVCRAPAPTPEVEYVL